MEYKLSIKQQYINNIKLGYKVHEYRLANEKRLVIKVGDTLLLSSESETIKVEVEDIKIYQDWSDAINLTTNSLKDFKGIFKNTDEILQECLTFYGKKDVKRYGIIVFKIKYNG